ncbi:MAG: family 10 glycosylhydrolase [bacterium]
MRNATLVMVLLMMTSPLWSQPKVLLVDDFRSDFDWRKIWLEDLESIGVKTDVIGVGGADAAKLSSADLVLWNCGNDTSDTLTTDNRAALSAYLDGGGNLLVVSPGLPAELFRGGDHSWLRDRLGCDYVMPNSPITWSSTYLGLSLRGDADSILEGVEFNLTFGPKSDVAADDLTLVHRVDQRASHLARFAEIPGYLGVARETPTDRTVLLTFPLESVRPFAARRSILRHCLEWLERTRYEGRGIWVVRNQLNSPENIDAIVESAAKAGFNTLFVQVRGRGDAFYQSATEPRATTLADQPADFDPLQRFIERAHARELQVHAWLNAGYIWNPGELPTDPKHIVNRKPEFVMVNRSGKSMIAYTAEEFRAQYSEGRFLSLAAPEVQNYLVGVYLEVVEKYDVDGIHFDFIRYPSRGVTAEYDLDYNPLVLKAFQAKYGYNPLDVEIGSARFETWLEWQRQQIGRLVGRIRDGAHAKRPGIRVSAAVLSRYHLGRHQASQDWIGWLRRGEIDTVCLMSYGADNDLVAQEGLLAQENRGKGTVWVGMGTRGDIGHIIDRIALVRDVVAPEGIMFFPWGGFDEADLNALLLGPFAAPAKVPSVKSD